MADFWFLYSFKTSIRLYGVNGLSLFDLCLLNELFTTSCQIIIFFSIIQLGELLKRWRTVFCRLFACKRKLKPGTALKVLSRRFCRVKGIVFTEWWRELIAMMNTIENDKRYGCFIGNQFNMRPKTAINLICVFGMLLKTGRAEQIFEDYPTTGGNRVRNSFKKFARHDWRLKRLTGETITVFPGFALYSYKTIFFVSENFEKCWYKCFFSKFFF